jgi:hypothetical protein
VRGLVEDGSIEESREERREWTIDTDSETALHNPLHTQHDTPL